MPLTEERWKRPQGLAVLDTAYDCQLPIIIVVVKIIYCIIYRKKPNKQF